jgi:hypothetical protein
MPCFPSDYAYGMQIREVLSCPIKQYQSQVSWAYLIELIMIFGTIDALNRIDIIEIAQ